MVSHCGYDFRHVPASLTTSILNCVKLKYSTSHFLFFFFSFISISWRLIASQHFSGFCHTLTWISHGVTCIPHPDPPSHLPLHPIPLGLPSAPGPCTCLMHPTWVHQPFSKWYVLVTVNCKLVVSKLPASQLFNHFRHSHTLLNKHLSISKPNYFSPPWLKATLIYYPATPEVTSLKIKVLTGLPSSGKLSGKSISLSFPVSRGHLHSLAHDHLPHRQGWQHSICKALWSSWPPATRTLTIPLGIPGNPGWFSILRILTFKIF